jgi:hypothetical protein
MACHELSCLDLSEQLIRTPADTVVMDFRDFD